MLRARRSNAATASLNGSGLTTGFGAAGGMSADHAVAPRAEARPREDLRELVEAELVEVSSQHALDLRLGGALGERFRQAVQLGHPAVLADQRVDGAIGPILLAAALLRGRHGVGLRIV